MVCKLRPQEPYRRAVLSLLSGKPTVASDIENAVVAAGKTSKDLHHDLARVTTVLVACECIKRGEELDSRQIAELFDILAGKPMTREMIEHGYLCSMEG